MMIVIITVVSMLAIIKYSCVFWKIWQRWTPTPRTTPRKQFMWRPHGASRERWWRWWWWWLSGNYFWTWCCWKAEDCLAIVRQKNHGKLLAWCKQLNTFCIKGSKSWGKTLFRRCDKLLFMSTEADDELGAVALPEISSGRASLWNKTRKVKVKDWFPRI